MTPLRARFIAHFTLKGMPQKPRRITCNQFFSFHNDLSAHPKRSSEKS
jgi:hypothetical protein